MNGMLADLMEEVGVEESFRRNLVKLDGSGTVGEERGCAQSGW